MIEVIKNIIIDFQCDFESIHVFDRQLKIPEAINIHKAFTIYGPRRAGKTYFLFSLIKRRLKKDLRIDDVVYINFEDNRLSMLTSENLDVITKAYWQLFPDKNPVLFLDEIQNIENWSKWVRKLVDQRFEVFITGSNSKLLSREIATELRGRTLSFLLLPLSFNEYLTYNQVVWSDSIMYHTKSKQKILSLLHQYLKTGGFPEIMKMKNLESDFLLQDYIKTIIYRDIADRYSIRNTHVLKLLINHCVRNFAGTFSIHKFYNQLKSLQIKTSKDTLYQYITYLEEALFVFQLPKKLYSYSKQEKELKKLYVCDLSYGNLFKNSADTGKLFENMIFLELYRKYQEHLYYYANGFECDFVIENESITLLQVCANLKNHPANADTYRREVSSLSKSMDFYKVQQGFIITIDETEIIKTDHKIIHVLSFVDFFNQFIINDIESN